MQDFLYNLTSGDYATVLSWQSVLEVVISASIIGFVILRKNVDKIKAQQ